LPGDRAQTITLNDGITAIDTEFARPQQDASHLIVGSTHCISKASVQTMSITFF
jgi:hypothetical protein